MRTKNIATFVYFVRREDDRGPIKIGCSYWPEERLKQLMCWSPYRLAIAATVPGDERLERRFHARFEHLWSHGEWFHVDAELARAVVEIANGTFDLNSLPEKGAPAGASKRVRQPWRPSQRANTILSHVYRSSGHDAPAELRALVARMDGLSEDELAAAWREIELYRDNPTIRGTLMDADWARYRFECWKERRARKAGRSTLQSAA